jgi:hypothetical protein
MWGKNAIKTEEILKFSKSLIGRADWQNKTKKEIL